jgi:sugar lactone lactonase YvrE
LLGFSGEVRLGLFVVLSCWIGWSLLIAPGASAQGGTPLSDVTADRTLTPDGNPYLMQGNVGVSNGATLTLQPGVRILSPGGVLEIGSGAKLIAQGTADQPITFTSASATPAAGDWQGLAFDPGSEAALDHCDVDYGGPAAQLQQAVAIGSGKVTLSNTVIHHSLSVGVRMTTAGEGPTLDHVTVSDCAKTAIRMDRPEISPTITGLLLQNNAPDGIEVAGGEIKIPTAYPAAGYPYSTDSLKVSAGGILTLQPGVEMRFTVSATLSVAAGGKLVAEGTAALPITFTTASSPPLPGSWGGIAFETGSQGSLSFCDIGFAGLTDFANTRIDSADVAMKNTTIHDSGSSGLSLYGHGETPTLDAVTIKNSAGAAIFMNTPDFSLPAPNLKLEGNHPDGIAIFSEVTLGLTRSVTLYNVGYPYYPQNPLVIQENATVTLQPGVEMRFGDRSYLSVKSGGQLLANGTADQPIRFTATTTAPQAGDWLGLMFAPGSRGSLAFCDVGYGGVLNQEAVSLGSRDVTLSHTTVHHSAEIGIRLTTAGEAPILDHVTVKDSRTAAIRLESPEISPRITGLLLQGNARDGIEIRSGAPAVPVTYPFTGYPYYADSLQPTTGGILTLQPGVEMRFTPATSLRVLDGGKLIAEGTAALPIHFTSSASPPDSGPWAGIYFEQGSGGSLAFCDIGYAGTLNSIHALALDTVIPLKNITIHDSTRNGLGLMGHSDAPPVEALTVKNSKEAPILLHTADYSLLPKGLKLEGNHPDGIVINNPSASGITKNVTFYNVGYPYYLQSAQTIQSKASLTIQPGVEMRLSDLGSSLSVMQDGRLTAEGTAKNPIVFTSDSTTPAAGGWQGITFFPDSQGSLAFCDIGFSGRNLNPTIQIISPFVSVRNSRIHDTKSDAITVGNNAGVALTGNLFENTPVAVNNLSPTTPVNAKENWWGDPTGPKHASNPTGTGVPVSNGVLFDPWIQSRDQAGPGSVVPPRPALLPFSLFDSEEAIWGILVDRNGQLFVSQTNPAVCLEKDGVCTPVAGTHVEGYSGDGGPAKQAQLNKPKGIAKDALDNLYIADSGNHRIRKVDPLGKISTIVGSDAPLDLGDGGPALMARLDNPEGIAIDASGNLYIADFAQNRVRKVDLSTGLISTYVGNGTAGFSGDGGPAAQAQLNGPRDVAVSSLGDLYITDFGNHRVRKVLTNGTIFTLTGTGTAGESGDGGPASQGQVTTPTGLAVDSDGTVYIGEYETGRVRLVKSQDTQLKQLSEPKLDTLVGAGAPGNPAEATAGLSQPIGLALDADGNLFVADSGTKTIKEMANAGGAGLQGGKPLPPAGTPPVVAGDVNGDTKVTVQDAVLVLRSVVGLAALSADQQLVADLDGDRKVNIQDVVLILLKAVGLFPGG